MPNIKEYEKNAKKHPEKQLELIAKSIKRFGWQQPIKVGKDNVIIVGHGRFQAYQKYKDHLELKPMWIINEQGETISGEAEKRVLTAKEEIAYRLADNKINESEWDIELVEEELELLDDELKELTGFDVLLEAEEDDIDFDNIESTENRERKFKDIDVTCPECGNNFKIEV
jgi:hypothetical protein